MLDWLATTRVTFVIKFDGDKLKSISQKPAATCNFFNCFPALQWFTLYFSFMLLCIKSLYPFRLLTLILSFPKICFTWYFIGYEQNLTQFGGELGWSEWSRSRDSVPTTVPNVKVQFKKFLKKNDDVITQLYLLTRLIFCIERCGWHNCSPIVRLQMETDSKQIDNKQSSTIE